MAFVSKTHEINATLHFKVVTRDSCTRTTQKISYKIKQFKAALSISLGNHLQQLKYKKKTTNNKTASTFKF
jgi:hypothetical protein